MVMTMISTRETSFGASRLTAEGDHLEIKSVLQPEFVHNMNYLQGQHVLT